VGPRVGLASPVCPASSNPKPSPIFRLAGNGPDRLISQGNIFTKINQLKSPINWDLRVSR
jgi:hypothetical protein